MSAEHERHEKTQKQPPTTRTRAQTRRRFGTFLFANISQRAGQVLLLLLLVAMAEPQDVTWFGLFGSFFLIVVPLATQNIHVAIGRLWFTFTSETEDARARAATTLLAVGLVLGVVGALLATLALRFTGGDFGLPSDIPGVYALMTVGAFAYVLATFSHALLRATDRVRSFFWFSVALSAGYPIGFVAAGHFHGYGFVAAGWAYVFAYVVSGLVGAVALRDLLSLRVFRPDPPLVRRALVFGSGTAVYSLTQWVVNCAGRWIGTAHIAAGDLAGYTLVTQLYAVVGSLTVVFFETYRVVILRKFSEGDRREALGMLWRPSMQAIAMACAVHAGVALVLPFIPGTLGEDYALRGSWILLSLGITVAGVFSMRASWIAECLLMTRRFAVISIVASALVVGLSIVFSRSWGVDGLLWAPILGIGAQAWASTWLLDRASSHR